MGRRCIHVISMFCVYLNIDLYERVVATATVVNAVIVHLAESKEVLTTVSSRLPGWIPVSGIRVSYLSLPLPFGAAFCTI